MKKLFSLVLSLCILTVAANASPTDTTAVEIHIAGNIVYAVPRSSAQLDSYEIILQDNGDGTLALSYAVYGTHDQMTCIGAKKIVVEEKLSNGRWTEWTSYSSQYAYNALYKAGEIEVPVLPGVTYRAILTAYGRDGVGSDTKTLTSVSVTAT